MCTLTYLRSRDGYIITANRDESPLRNASAPKLYRNSEGEPYFIAPEPVHRGSNIAVGIDSVSVLLNGAFEPHDHDPPYSKSRGLVVLDSLDLDSLSELNTLSLEGVEPFTLVRFGRGIEELRWDGVKSHLKIVDKTKPAIWASAQLYSPEARANRENWFESLLAKFDGNPEMVFDFHQNGGNGDPENDMVMNRSGLVRTVSITQVVDSNGPRLFKHLNLLEGKETSRELSHDRL